MKKLIYFLATTEIVFLAVKNKINISAIDDVFINYIYNFYNYFGMAFVGLAAALLITRLRLGRKANKKVKGPKPKKKRTRFLLYLVFLAGIGFYIGYLINTGQFS